MLSAGKEYKKLNNERMKNRTENNKSKINNNVPQLNIMKTSEKS